MRRSSDRGGDRGRDRDRGLPPPPEEAPLDPEREAELLAEIEGGSEDEEERLIRERRQRMNVIKAKHEAANAAADSTATAALISSKESAPASNAGDPVAHSNGGVPTSDGLLNGAAAVSEGTAPPNGQPVSRILQKVVSQAAMDLDPVSVPGSPRSSQRGGTESPDVLSDAEEEVVNSGGGADSLDIWQSGGGADGEAKGAPEGGDEGDTRMADVSEGEFAAEAQMAQEQTQASS